MTPVYPETYELLNELLRRPPNSENYATRINIIAQHVSGRTYTSQIKDRSGFRHSNGMRPLRHLLARIFRMYMQGKLKGDLLFHKTNCHDWNNLKIGWPLKVRNGDNSSEHWIITGHIGWFHHFRENMSIPERPMYDTCSTNGMQETLRWCVEVGLADRTQAEKMCMYDSFEMPRISLARFSDRCQRYQRRLEMVSVIRSMVKETHRFDYYMREFDIPRFGAWRYKNGRVSFYIGGSLESCHIIDIHGNRNTDLGGN